MLLARIQVTSYKNQEKPDLSYGLHLFENTFMHKDTYCLCFIYNFYYYLNEPEHPVIRLIKRKHISSKLFAINR